VITVVLALAQLCASEAGLRTDVGDCPAIYHVIRRRSERSGLSWIAMARRYSTRVYDAERTGSRRYLPHLRLDGRRPRHWPEGHSWARYRPRWLALVDHSRAVVAGEVEDPCPGALHWGGRMDDHRAVRAGWSRVECSAPTLNRFWDGVRRRR